MTDARTITEFRDIAADIAEWVQSIAVTERAYAFLNVEHLHKAIEHAPALERPVIEGEAEEIEDDGRPRIS